MITKEEYLKAKQIVTEYESSEKDKVEEVPGIDPQFYNKDGKMHCKCGYPAVNWRGGNDNWLCGGITAYGCSYDKYKPEYWDRKIKEEQELEQ